jgi:hypothetical protein
MYDPVERDGLIWRRAALRQPTLVPMLGVKDWVGICHEKLRVMPLQLLTRTWIID